MVWGSGGGRRVNLVDADTAGSDANLLLLRPGLALRGRGTAVRARVRGAAQRRRRRSALGRLPQVAAGPPQWSAWTAWAAKAGLRRFPVAAIRTTPSSCGWRSIAGPTGLEGPRRAGRSGFNATAREVCPPAPARPPFKKRILKQQQSQHAARTQSALARPQINGRAADFADRAAAAA